jgi:TolA-binding protein
LAACYKQKGDTAKALEEFLKVAILYPNDRWGARAQYEAGQCSEQLQNKDAAIKAYQILIRDYPTQQQWVDQAQARLKALQP